MGVFYSTLPFGDAVSNAAQAFLPAARTPCRRRQTTRNVMRLGVLTGAGTCALVGLPLAMPSLRALFTVDVAVRDALGQLLPFACACSFAFNVASAAEGCLIAARDLRPVSSLYAASPVFTAAMLLGLARANGGALAVAGALAAWATFTSFHLIRLGVFAGRLAVVVHVGRQDKVARRRGRERTGRW